MTTTQQDIMDLQKLLNETESDHLTIDGDFGPVTRAALQSAVLKHALPISTASLSPGRVTYTPEQIALTAKVCAQHTGLIITSEMVQKALWMCCLGVRYGWNEANNNTELAALIAPYSNFADWGRDKSVRGSSLAWCMGIGNAAYESVGIHGTGDAGADSGRSFGVACEDLFGAGVPITHATGKHHWTFFAGWKNKAARIGYFLGGNQSDAIQISVYDVSGNANGHDQVIPGFRWPAGMPLGIVAPDLNIGGAVATGGSTR